MKCYSPADSAPHLI